ncbi:hypothetical protein M899_2382 [Bacteriovorax sp. BSW11_IV]|uniref:hypothetical protein n=1 Tax=Bacteriovorax sp. BSW11_IV TaxID=1353529 RepID=UPI00038A14EA|nr:hypothetical protein [Bacteriovorax sp. BSW11_IV]EQC44525.1 hypothetical protein M899_2382 [Bacteriovorax sp. BSW11_IV]
MGYFKKRQSEDKVFRGSYAYTRNDNVYCEETFEVFRDRKDYTTTFQSQLISRVATGELLNINVDYTVNKDFIPQKVIIDRALGEEKVTELFLFDSKATRIQYSFISRAGEEKVVLPSSPKFHIATPAMCTCMLFIRSKKFENTGRNYYSTLVSRNLWTYEEEPVFKNIVVQRQSTSTENLTIEGNTVQSVQYKVQEQLEGVETEDSLRIWLSQHLTIPYLVRTPEGTKIQIKYLNNLDKEQ